MAVVAADDLENGVVVEHVGEPVGAQQHGVAGDEVIGGDVEVHLAAHAERLGEDVLHGPRDAAVFGVPCADPPENVEIPGTIPSSERLMIGRFARWVRQAELPTPLQAYQAALQ